MNQVLVAQFLLLGHRDQQRNGTKYPRVNDICKYCQVTLAMVLISNVIVQHVRHLKACIHKQKLYAY